MTRTDDADGLCFKPGNHYGAQVRPIKLYHQRIAYTPSTVLPTTYLLPTYLLPTLPTLLPTNLVLPSKDARTHVQPRNNNTRTHNLHTPITYAYKRVRARAAA